MTFFILFGLLVVSLIIVVYILLVLTALYICVRMKIAREKSMLNTDAEPVFD